MTPQPASSEDVSDARMSLIGYFGIIVAVAFLLITTASWLDARKVPTITFVATPQGQIAVDVRGAVSTPGVIYLDSGARMIDVVNTSGGLSSDADRSLVNMSSRVMDGQLVVIPTQVPDGDVGAATSLININSASVDELKELPGIGDVLAQRIVAYREVNGPFQTTGELHNVEGVSTSLVESLQPYISVSGND